MDYIYTHFFFRAKWPIILFSFLIIMHMNEGTFASENIQRKDEVLLLLSEGRFFKASAVDNELGTWRISLLGSKENISQNVLIPKEKETVIFAKDQIYKGAFSNGKKVFERRNMVLSPDGKNLTFVSRKSARDLESYLFHQNLEKGTIEPLTFEGVARAPIWTLDGTSIIFYWGKSAKVLQEDGFSLIQINLKTKSTKELSRPSKQTRWTPERDVPPVLSPDGKTILFEANYSDDNRRYIYSVTLDNGNVKKLIEGAHPNFSLEGTKIIFSNRGIFELNLVTGGKTCLAEGKGIDIQIWPKVSRSGKYIAYVKRNNLFVMTTDGKNKRKVSDKRIISPNHFSWAHGDKLYSK